VAEAEPFFGYCNAGHGWSEVREYDGLLLCVRRCWPRKERVASQIRGIIERKEGRIGNRSRRNVQASG
jgi:hypothetical protein